MPYVILLLVTLGMLCFFCKLWRTALCFLLFAVGANYATECIPLHFEAEERGSFRILSANILMGGEEDVESQQCVARLLIGQQADVLVLLEFYPVQRTTLHDSLLAAYPHYQYRDANGPIAVYSKFSLTALDGLYVDNDAEGWQRARCMSKIWVEMDSARVCLIPCHLSSNRMKTVGATLSDTMDVQERATAYLGGYRSGADEREVEAKALLQEVKALRTQGERVIVLGDMNDVPGSSVMRGLSADGTLSNAWWEKGCGLGNTYHDHYIMHFRIDHVLHTDNIPLRAVRIVNLDFSDHDAILTEFD